MATRRGAARRRHPRRLDARFFASAGNVASDRELAEPNRALAAYARWHELLDAFIVLRARDPHYVLDWRVQAEEAMKARGLPGLDRAAIEDYIRRFLPAYATYAGVPHRYGPGRATLTIWLEYAIARAVPFT